MYQRALEVIKC